VRQHPARSGRTDKGIDFRQDVDDVHGTSVVAEKSGVHALHVLHQEFAKGQLISSFRPKARRLCKACTSFFFVRNDPRRTIVANCTDVTLGCKSNVVAASKTNCGFQARGCVHELKCKTLRNSLLLAPGTIL
jgi:hypothetical protein